MLLVPTTTAYLTSPELHDTYAVRNGERPAVPTIRFAAFEDERIHDAWVHGALFSPQEAASAAQGAVFSLRGHYCSWAQLQRAIGRHSYLLGTNIGWQSEMRRMAAAAAGIAPVRSARRSAWTFVNRSFGIEVEFNAPDRHTSITSEVVYFMRHEGGIAANDYCGYAPHVARPEWTMSTDCTVSGGEFISPILPTTGAGLRQVEAALSAVRRAGGTPGRNQGMHVHHDVRDFNEADMRLLVHNLRNAQDALLAYVPQYRTDGSVSHSANKISSQGWRSFASEVDNGYLVPRSDRSARDRYNRYQAFNFSAVIVQGSVEFRALGNTLNASKVRAWVLVGAAVIAFTKAGNVIPVGTTPESLIEQLTAARLLPVREARKFLSVCVARRTSTRAANAA